MPGLLAELYAAKISAMHVVAKGRQSPDAANTVQVRVKIETAAWSALAASDSTEASCRTPC